MTPPLIGIGRPFGADFLPGEMGRGRVESPWGLGTGMSVIEKSRGVNYPLGCVEIVYCCYQFGAKRELLWN